MSLPNPGPARDAAVIAAITNGDYEAGFADVTSTIPGHTATFRIFPDALKIGGVRVTLSAYLEQTVADMLGCSLLTAKLMDLLFQQASLILPPHTQVPDATMVTTAVMEKQSAWIDSQIPAGQTGIIQTLGKGWLIDNLLLRPATVGKAINYGWHFRGSFQGQSWAPSVTNSSVRVVQNRGWAHAPQEVDYSQNCILVSRQCVVDAQPRDLLDVFADPTLAGLANADGVLKVTRQPGVPVAPFVGTPVSPSSSGTKQASLLPLAVVAAIGAGLGIKLVNSRRF